MAWFSGPRSHSSRHSSSSSYYRRRPRDGYIQRMIHKIKRMMRDAYGYARRHPMKVFMLVIMPLITGGALANILKQFGIKLPVGMLGGLGKGGYEDSFGGSGGAHGDLGGGGGIQSIMRIAQMFM